MFKRPKPRNGIASVREGYLQSEMASWVIVINS
jgi:hypothetical protein